MNLEHIDPGDVIEQTKKVYRKLELEQKPFEAGLSRQVQALAYVLTEQINARLLDIENASE
jgi:hypothetical protein